MSIPREANVGAMMSGVTMLETNAAMAVTKWRIDADPMSLALGLLAPISRTLWDPDADTEGNSKSRTIAFIAGM